MSMASMLEIQGIEGSLIDNLGISNGVKEQVPSQASETELVIFALLGTA